MRKLFFALFLYILPFWLCAQNQNQTIGQSLALAGNSVTATSSNGLKRMYAPRDLSFFYYPNESRIVVENTHFGAGTDEAQVFAGPMNSVTAPSTTTNAAKIAYIQTTTLQGGAAGLGVSGGGPLGESVQISGKSVKVTHVGGAVSMYYSDNLLFFYYPPERLIIETINQLAGTDAAHVFDGPFSSVTIPSTTTTAAKVAYIQNTALQFATGSGGGGGGGLATVATDGTLTGSGESFNPLSIAQNGATTGQALTWNGAAWTPSTLAGGTFRNEATSIGASTNAQNVYQAGKIGAGNFATAPINALFHAYNNGSTADKSAFLRLSSASTLNGYTGGIQGYLGTDNQKVFEIAKWAGSNDLNINNFAEGGINISPNGYPAITATNGGIIKLRHYTELEEIDTSTIRPSRYLYRNPTTNRIEERLADLDYRPFHTYVGGKALAADDAINIIDCSTALTANMLITLPVPRPLTVNNIGADENAECIIKFENVPTSYSFNIRLRTHNSGNVNANGDGTTVSTACYFWDASCAYSGTVIPTTVKAHILNNIFSNNLTLKFKLKNHGSGIWYWHQID